jgi:hypothetical protein
MFSNIVDMLMALSYRPIHGVLMMVAVVDPEDQTMPLAFALVEGQINDSWSWSIQLLWINVLGTSCSISMISDRHIRLLS